MAAAPARATTRPSETTRRALIEAATDVFAEHGYERGSVRLITGAAAANQAAVTYHFGGKENLYREVLRSAIAAFEDQSLLNDAALERLSAEEALALLVRQLLVALVKRDQLGRYMRIFAWESATPSPVFATFMANETPPVFLQAERIVRRFLPAQAPPQEVALAVFWVIEQPIAIVRNADRLAAPPFDLKLSGPGAIDALVERLTRLCLGGLRGSGTPPVSA